ncbi:DUF2931 family protein [Pseudomonas typographi]|uniref:DUF2931 family protein n=1 Tax=Pseudomonas typographi TaxID=2715964 RepID=UPI0016870E78|nr:DUF2931 family protein [Pseudomonas typographi]MBD1550233.1 DUF2931 family protein [Pseudomonas typographi]
MPVPLPLPRSTRAAHPAKAVLAIVALLLASCTKGQSGLPYDAWRLGFFAPNYMDVWIETADVVDIKGRIFRRAMAGVASISRPAGLKGNPRGWPTDPGWGAGKHVRGAALPRLIYVRWQSLVEPQTYEAYIPIPEATHIAMVKSKKTFCEFDGKWIIDHRYGLTVGLAPGGIAKVWISGPCLAPIEVTRVQADVAKLGPDSGRSGGVYALPLKPQSEAYIQKYGIPYDTW